LISHKLVERTVVVGDLSQRQMVMQQHKERNKALNRAVYNDWGLYTFTQMLLYKCLLYGKDLVFLDEKYTSKECSDCGHRQDMPLWKRVYRCTECGLVMDRDENSAVNILKRYLARLAPHTPRECGVLHEDFLDVASTRLAQDGHVQQLELFTHLNTF
jgi:putative transposase